MNSIETLSERERQVSDLVMQGMSNKQIALNLGISERTVEFHLNNIYTKLQVGSRVELAINLLKATGNDNKADLVESTVDAGAESTHNDSQLNAKARRAKALKTMLSLIKKETVTTMNIFSEDFKNYFRTRPLPVAALIIFGVFFTAHSIVFHYGLYFPISYILLGVLLAVGSLHFGLSWHKIRDGRYKLRPMVALALVLAPLIVIALDTVLLQTMGRNAGEVKINLPGLSNRAAWLTSTSGPLRLSLERSTTDHQIWVIGSILYGFLIALIGNIARRFSKSDQATA
jgi:DNA-binding CsgD family transcriptional regulator